MNYNLVDPATGQVVGTVTMGQSANSGTPSAPSSQPSIRLLQGERVEVTLAANQVQAFTMDHFGGMMELKVDAAAGKGTFNTLTESLSGPQGFPEQKVSPAGTLKTHTAVSAQMPPGLYTYTVAADMDTVLHVLKNQ